MKGCNQCRRLRDRDRDSARQLFDADLFSRLGCRDDASGVRAAREGSSGEMPPLGREEAGNGGRR